MRTPPLFVILLFCATALVARADYLFTWEGNSDLFQGSFKVIDAEMPSNQFYYQLSLTNSISITSPDRLNYRWSPGPASGFADSAGVNASSPIFAFYINLYYPQPTSLGDYLEVKADYNTIQEWDLPVGNGYILAGETGLWNVTYIPEPSTTAMLALGTAAWLIKRKRAPRPRKARLK